MPVTSASGTGTLSAGTTITDVNSFATVTLDTSRQSKVTANVAGKTADVTVGLNPRTGITLAGPTTPVSAGMPGDLYRQHRDHREHSRHRHRLQRWLDGRSGAQWFDDDQQHLRRGRRLRRLGNRRRSDGFTETVSTDITVLPGQPPGVDRHGLGSNADREPDGYVHRDRQRATSTIQSYQWGVRRRHDRRHHRPRSRCRTTQPGTKVVSVTIVQAVDP